ncbi:AHH domain-containing protein [Paucibacter soli]|uniref:AHH domain-containing protein n=1 Tax=Paucibacter soli TaxID=3133433 RepID=UPI0030B0D643
MIALAAPTKASAGLLDFTPKNILIGGALGVAAIAVDGYVKRCAAGGGEFDALGEFHPGSSLLTQQGLGMRLTCPTTPDDWTKPKYAYAAYELQQEIGIFKVTDKLRGNMKAAGKGVGPAGCAAHHIVPEKGYGGTPEQPSLSDLSRRMLERCKIDINDAINGVFLPNRKDPKESNCTGAYHPKLHKENYFQHVLDKLVTGFDAEQCAGVRTALKELSDELSSSGREFRPSSLSLEGQGEQIFRGSN